MTKAPNAGRKTIELRKITEILSIVITNPRLFYSDLRVRVGGPARPAG